MLIGQWNHGDVIIGEKGYGKSTFACALTLRYQRSAGAYVIGHSLGGRLPRRLPPSLGGHSLPIEYHETLDDVRRGVFWRPAKWHILAPAPGKSAGATADDLLMFSQSMSDAIRERAWRKKHWGRWKHNANHDDVDAPPIVVLIDEGIAVRGAQQGSRQETSQWFMEYLISLRHLHIALVWNMQDPNLRSWQIMGQATDLYIFHTSHQYALHSLWAAGVSETELDRIRNLPKFEHVHIDRSRIVKMDWRAAAATKNVAGSTPLRDTPVENKP